MKIRNLFNLPKSKYDTRTIVRWLWQAWRGNRLQATLNAVIGLLGVVVSLAQVGAVQHAIDVSTPALQGHACNPHRIVIAVVIMALLMLAGLLLTIASTWVSNILGIRAQNRMQQRMLDRILRTQWHGREKFHSGDVLNRLEFDVNNVVTFLTETIPDSLAVLAMFIGAFCYLFAMDAVLAIITIAIIPVFVAVSKIYVRQMRRLTSEVRSSDSKVQSLMQETIQHRMLIKTLESETPMTERLEQTQSVLRHKVVRRTVFSVFSNIILWLGFRLGYLIAFLWAALRMSHGSLTFGGMTAFLQLVSRIQGPARSLTKLVPQAVSVFTAAERLMELEEDPLDETGEPVRLEAPCGIRLEHVYYQYDDKTREILHDLSFDFPPASCTAILGETGAGKTTLIRILLALLSPQQGKATIYNNHHQETAVTPLTRCNFAYVPQGNTLLSGTIRDNLRLGRLTATEEEMKEALHKSCADFVFDLPDGLNTLCSEAGGGLSEGQAQRIAIARALLRQSSILVLDEATSALDPETERQLLNNILADRNTTVIFVTHRMAVIDYCDQTLKITRT
jgi:ABC-type multidrug transport system fused ATPase/permease subunit